MNILTLNCTVLYCTLYVLYVCTFAIYYVCILVSGNMVAAEMLTGLVLLSAREETSIFSVLLLAQLHRKCSARDRGFTQALLCLGHGTCHP